MTTQVNPEYSQPYRLMPEDMAILNAAFPMLQDLRDNSKIITGKLPSDYGERPNQAYRISPYYMNMQDDKNTGVWKVEIGGDFSARIGSAAVPDGVDYLVTVADDSDIGHHEATVNEVEEVCALFKYIQPHYDASKKTEKPEQGVARRLAKVIFKN